MTTFIRRSTAALFFVLWVVLAVVLLPLTPFVSIPVGLVVAIAGASLYGGVMAFVFGAWGMLAGTEPE